MTTPDPLTTVPFDRQAALAELYALGRKLNAMTSAHHQEIETTLARMKALHTAVSYHLANS
ncbi:hypothetical protein ACFYNO_20150 [Kitasatospora sp. NPDC006697]|uniref:hypothetical protein n=1 Tax=Kitasatospora sp. NPDC006697 TaxID=3364020 RepID=UPI003693CB86